MQAGKFGSSLEVLDLNHDGRLDLAIGAPNIGADSLTYTVSTDAKFFTRDQAYFPGPKKYVANYYADITNIPLILLILRLILCHMSDKHFFAQ